MSWNARAACRDYDPALWFPRHFVPNKNPTAEALGICRRCPVQEQCLDQGLSFDPPVIGIWGGKWLGTGELSPSRSVRRGDMTEEQLRDKVAIMAREGLNAAAIARALLVPLPRVERALRPHDGA